MPIFVQDFQPLSASDYFNEKIRQDEDRHNQVWRAPFENESGNAWNLQPTQYILDDLSDKQHTIVFRPNARYTFRPTYAYNNHSPGNVHPVCSDLMIRFFVRSLSTDGCIGASLEKRGILYSARVDYTGTVTFLKTVDGVTAELGVPRQTEPVTPDTFQKFEFANVDHQLVLWWNQQRFTCDLSKQMQPEVQDEQVPAVKIFAVGPAQICHLGLYRDIFYLGKEEMAQRATEDDPFTLQDDQFFVCGDNCNNSSDARQWSKPGIGNNGQTYREGTVPREYMMGKAVMVYWSQAFEPGPIFPPMIPNLGNIKVIYGGSEQRY